ncbi:hypothetical protein NQZ79_g1066 [Umbelopsis isabellina]|nr:hypothetical protein NQZ79_g1066 [Umbelopsis isabellina]
MQSSDDDSDDMPVALSHQLRRTKDSGPPSQADRRHLARAKTMNSGTTSRNQSNLTRSNTEHHKGRGYREERSAPGSSKKDDEDSSDDIPVRGRGAERNDRGAANKPGKIRTHDVRNVQADLHRLQLASVQKIASRIYVIDSSKYVNLQLTSLMTTAMVLESLRERAVIDQEQSWTLFELANKVGVERPLRDWEIVTDILSTWDQDEKNALLVKKYSYKSTLTSESVLGKSEFVPPSGQLHFEYKRGKWHKRSFTVKDNGIYLSRDSKKAGDAPVVPLANVDVYTLTTPIKKAPTPFGFILKAQQKARIFENPEDFVFSFCADDMEQLKLWVLGLRQVKATFYTSNPARLLSPLKPLELPPLPQSVVHKVLSPNEKTPLIDQQQLLNAEPEPKLIPSVSSEISKGSTSKIHRSATLLERSMQSERVDDGNKATVRRYKSTREINSSSRQAEPLVGSDLEADYRRQPDMPGKPVMLRPSKSLGTRRTTNSSKYQDYSADVPRVGRSEDRRQLEKGNMSGSNERYSPVQSEDGSALVKLNENFHFSEGSLLQQASDTVVPRGRSKSISRDPRRGRSQSRPRHASVSDSKEQGSSTTRSKSLRRKPTVKGANDRDTEVHPPLPKASAEDGPLLQLDLTPEASHTKALRDRQVKPLITF